MPPSTRVRRHLDILVGILGFFTAVALVNTVVLEVRGEPALRAALVLLGFVLALGAVWRVRRR
ncbi:hypothetical protein HC031_21675 [Planosporangium thailandense]|uniref:Secreted protein with PEP-CTERM sorting signal n=1 Tax=Planosporangium thailandense TaxID=765197 RepID=A0ABX0Y4H3_9ACTN|nr:hypothetical protein [Planosporangium thailandense]NJC72305.1 hypothetical protein [Planosporangium thailandense]